ncbi:hypothetical protein CPB85DRAFT_139040 [Mucidula mucida]|nr:hypothetical protein CPB85DRAFT_139040 [Mucidula mucida]
MGLFQRVMETTRRRTRGLSQNSQCLTHSVGQAMGVSVISRRLIIFFTTFIAWCVTLASSFKDGACTAATSRVLLHLILIWNTIQCWNGGKLVLLLSFPSSPI